MLSRCMKLSDLSYSDIQQLYKEYSPLKSECSLLDILYKINKNAYYNLNNRSVRDFITSTLYSDYPNEASLKSAFINKKLARSSSSISIFEFPLGNSRVDLCKINRSSYAYEIKTDLDNFRRLDKQLYDYMQVFEYTSVICSNNKLQDTITAVPNGIGIIFYYHKSHNYCFHTYREPKISPIISPHAQLKTLSVYELRKIKQKYCLEEGADNEALASKLSSHQINMEFKKAIQKRYQRQWFFLKRFKNEISNIDYQFFFKTCMKPSDVYQ